MFEWLKYAAAFVIAFVVTFVVTPLVIRVATAAGVVDQPDERRIHTRPTPRGGGLAVFFGFAVAMAVVIGYVQGALDALWMCGFAPAATLLVLVGLADDRFNLRPLVKLAGQIAAAVLLYVMTGKGFGLLLGVRLPEWADLVVTVFWVLAVTNAFNLIDGLDGLAAGLAAIAALGMAAVFVVARHSTDALIPLALAGSCIAFLRYNFYPARVFLGDTGSLFLGFTLGAISLHTGSKTTFLAAVGVPLLAFGVPLFDTLLAVWRRSLRALFPTAFDLLRRRGGIMQADRNHIHHRIMGAGHSQSRVALTLYAINLFLVAVAVLATTFRSKALGIFIFGLLVMVFMGVRIIARSELWDTGRVILHGLRRPRIPTLSSVTYMMWDFVILALAALAVAFVDVRLGSEMRVKDAWFYFLPVWTSPSLVLLVLFRVYRRIWSSAMLIDYAWLVLAVTAGAGLSAAADLIRRPSDPVMMPQAVIFVAVSLAGLVGGRALVRIIGEGMALGAMVSTRSRDGSAVRPVLIAGAGINCRLLLRQMLWLGHEAAAGTRIVGIVADDPVLRDRLLFGIRVVGCVADIPELIRKHAVAKIIVTEEIEPDGFETLRAAAAAAGVEVTRWTCGERRVGAGSPSVD